MTRKRRTNNRGLYRSRQGLIFGVCRGIAEYFDFSVTWTRFLAIFLLLVTGIWPVAGLYFIAALIMRPAPVIPIHSEDEQEFYDSYTHSRYRAVQRLRHRFQKLERRIRRMEDFVTSKEFDWEQRLNS